MTTTPFDPTQTASQPLGPKIAVIGVGGAGNNAVNNMIRYKLQGVEYLACNTDAQHLEQSLVQADRRVQLGLDVTQGLGAGSKPQVGRASAEESLDDVIRHLKGCNMVFITAGMGGGTGTGAAPVIAQAAREMGILTVGVVTKPFNFEGPHRTKMADGGIIEMEQYVDTLIVIPNQNLFRIATDKTTFADAFKMADDVLYSGVRGVTDLMIMPGLVNLDFADIRAVMTEMGKAMMGTGEATGENRAIEAAEAAISNPLLDDVSMRGAKGVLINITGGMDMTLFEVDAAANRIREEIDADITIETNIIFGSTFDESLEGKMRVSVVATGIDSEEIAKRLEELNAEKKVQEAAKIQAELDAQHQKEMQLSMDAEFTLAGQSEHHTQSETAGFETYAASYNDDQDPHHMTVTAAEDSFKAPMDHAHYEQDPAGAANDEFHYQDDVPQKRKKSFFGRFFSTLSGQDDTHQDEEGYRNHPQASVFPDEGAPSTVSGNYHGVATDGNFEGLQKEPNAALNDFDQQDVQDIPAYLRRKAK